MSYFSVIVVGVMVAFALASIVDGLFFDGKHGLYAEFQRGMEIMGPICLAITGIISLVPAIAWLINHTLTPLYETLGLDPALAVGTILANDMGGFQLAASVALDPVVGKWAGGIYASMMGATLVFSIPVGLAAIQKQDTAAFSQGILYGIAAIPVGTFVGGVLLGIPVGVALKNLIVPALFSLLIIVSLIKFPDQTIRIFTRFSEFVNAVALVGLGLAMIKDLVLLPLAEAGLFNLESVPLFNFIAPTSEGIAVAGAVGLVLSGTLPFVTCLNKWLKKPLSSISEKTGLSEVGLTGFLLSAANNMAMFATLDQMKEKEKILNVAFAVCAAFIIGDHLAFTAANAPDCIAAMMAAKLTSGIIAVILAATFTKNKAPSSS